MKNVCSFLAKLCPAIALTCLSIVPLYSAINPAHEAQIDALLAQMSVDEKLGQISMVMENQLIESEVTTHFLGSLLVGPGINYHPGLETPPVATKWADRYDAFQNAAIATPLQIPLLVVADAIHGHGEAVGATIFPHNIGLAATGDAELMQRLGSLVAREVAATGVDGILGPCVAINRDIRWGRTYEGWGDHPNTTTNMIAAFIEGVQAPYNGADSIIACAKHYIADGGATWGTGRDGRIDQGNVQVDESTLRAIHLPPYEEAIAAGVSMIMASYGQWNGLELHHHKYLLTDVLKTELGFDGILVSDFSGFVDSAYPEFDTMEEAAPSALNAGIDLFMMGDTWKTFAPAMKTALGNGTITEARLNDAVRRVLRVKLRHGLFAKPLTDRTLTNGDVLGSATHRSISREAAQKSLVLLRNQNNRLPLPKSSRILLVGSKANDIGVQCGGWTVEWGGLTGAAAEASITGTTLLEGIQAAVSGAGGSVTHSLDGNISGDFDIIIVAVGENPTAEWFGDNNELSLSATEASLLRNLQSKGLPIVVVFFANRPLLITDRIDLWDSVVMAWLPGTEGGLALADCLFGDVPFTGRLPVAWPRAREQFPLNFGEQTKNPLFPRGFGINTSVAKVTSLKPTPARINQPYTYSLQASGLTSPQFSISEGTLPNGLVLGANGQISGTPTSLGYYHLVVKATGTQGGQAAERYQGLSLLVVDKTFYEQWVSAINWPVPTQTSSLRNADPDNDGIPNGLEFLQGTNPLVADSELWPLPDASFINNRRALHLRLKLMKDRALTGYLVESSQNLSTWTTVTAPAEILSEDGTSIEYEYRSGFSNNLPYFLRVRLLEE